MRNFFLGNVKLIKQGFFRATYVIEDTDCIIKVKNHRHVRCSEFNSPGQNHLMWEEYFEIIAPMDAVKTLKGIIPSNLIEIMSDTDYLSRRMRWDGV